MKAGIAFRLAEFPANAAQRDVDAGIDELVHDAGVHGIFLQFPLPPQIDLRTTVRRVPLEKDVDRPIPATPFGIVRILEQNRIATRGVRVTVVGNASGIARPLVTLFEERGNDVTHVDADDAYLAVVTQTADILASAVERPGVISAVHVKPGATVVDAGYNRTARGVVGDVDLGSVERIAGAVLPMPGGIGPVTIAILLERTWDAAREQDTRAGVS